MTRSGDDPNPGQPTDDAGGASVTRSNPPGDPVPLEYFPVNAPEQRRVRVVTILSFVLLAGWLPYLCGVINASMVPVVYTPPVINAHRNGGVLFMSAGILFSAIGLVGFLRLKHPVGTWAAAIVLAVQVTMAVCAGLAV